ncbi:S9 family peptidase [Sphingomonas oligophenolica]|uniref:S9 family peptidase n=1 Tax=Sphingomonas oligophenolica TaxID=301154 RepID=A0ABU9Y8G2_9SPHN
MGRRPGLAHSGLLVAAALLLGAASPPPDADAGGPITPADIMKLKDTRSARISPDGKTILFPVQDQISTFGSPHIAIWSVPADGSAPARALIETKGVNSDPTWSPDGKWIAFLSDRGSTSERPLPSQIWLMPASGGTPVQLTSLPSDAGSFAWSPDSRSIALLAADPPTAEEKADLAAKRDSIEVDTVKHLNRLWIVDIASHAAHQPALENLNIGSASWAPDGKRLALNVTDTVSINEYFYHSRVVLFDLTTGAVTPTPLDNVAGPTDWSPDGRTILSEEILQPGFIGLAPRLLDIASGKVTRIAADYPGLLSDTHWSPDGRSILALSFERTRSKLVRLSIDGKASPVAAFDGEAAGYSVSHDGRTIALALSSPDRPADVWVVARGVPKVVTRTNPQVAAWHLGKVQEISWQNSKDGKTIFGVLVTPPGYVRGTPTRMVVQIHGGPEWAWWSGWLGSWHEWAQMLATHGYVVFLPNPRGSDGQGTDFARAVGDDWGGMDYQDVMSGVDALVAQKIADPDRLGIGGWSYGGFMSAWAVTHGDRFKAAVVGAGPTDLTAFSRITDTPDFTLGYFGDVPGHLARYDRSSPARLLSDKVTAAVLVLHGEQDTRVPPTLGLEFYRGLKMLGKQAEMVRYPREPHWFHEPAHQEDIQRRVLDWFDKHL